MDKALVIVEGAVTESDLFDRVARLFDMDLQIHAVASNIYDLYQRLKEQDFAIDIRDVLDDMTADPDIKAMLHAEYGYYFLIYDCDIQDTRYRDSENPLPIGDRARINCAELEEMIRQLNDEEDETKGKLFVNYPMMESYCDCDSFYEDEFRETMVSLATLDKEGEYKRWVRHRLVGRKDVSLLSEEDLLGLMRMNAAKSYSLITGEWKIPDYAVYERTCNDLNVLQKQKSQIERGQELSVLNTSLLFPVYRFGNNRGLYDRISDVPRHPLFTVLIVCDAGGERDVETTLRSLRAQRMSRWNHRIVCRHDAQSLVLTGDVCEWVMFVRAGDVVQPGSLTSAKGLIELCPQARLCIYDACAQVRRLSDGRPDWGECVHVHRQALHPEKIRRLAPVPIMKTLHRRDLVDRSLDAWLLLSVGETLDRVGLGTGGALIEVTST